MARRQMRRKFVEGEMGITGANFGVAETGSIGIVTNEGNGDLTATLPKTHIVTTGIDKIVPTLEDATTLLRLLSRSATGQDFTAYTTFFTGPKRGQDLDGAARKDVKLVGLMYVTVKRSRQELGEDNDARDARVDAVADGNIDQPIPAADGYGRFGA